MNIDSDFFNNKKLFLFLVILLLGFVCIGSSFAVDMDDSSSLNDVVSDDFHIRAVDANVNDVGSNNHIKSSSISVNSNAVVNAAISESSNKNLIKSAPHFYTKTFVTSNEDIIYALESGYSEIVLTSDITVYGAIKISRDTKIDGNGHTIELGKNTLNAYAENIFYITNPNCIICNCIFNNCDRDSAIYSVGNSYLRVINCTFNNCYASDGGAIFISYPNSEIINCTFCNCSASGKGGAIYSNAVNSKVINCNFINATAKKGGAIYLGGHNGYVYKCTFRNVTTIDSWFAEGKVIFCYQSDSKIKDSIFYVRVTDGDIIHWKQKKGAEEKCFSLVNYK